MSNAIATLTAALAEIQNQITGLAQNTPIPEAAPSAEVMEAQKKREASIEQDAIGHGERFLEFYKGEGFDAEHVASLNASIAKDQVFKYNFTRKRFEDDAQRLAYWNTKQTGEISAVKVSYYEEQMAQHRSTLEQCEVINRACQLNFDELFAWYEKDVLVQIADHDRRAQQEDYFLRYKSPACITDAAYREYCIKDEQRQANKRKTDAAATVNTEHLLLTTERVKKLA